MTTVRSIQIGGIQFRTVKCFCLSILEVTWIVQHSTSDSKRSHCPGRTSMGVWTAIGEAAVTFYKSLNKKMQMIIMKECFMTDMGEREREMWATN